MSASETSIGGQTSRKGNPMSGLINRFATPLTTGLFVVSAVSGVFHWQSGAFHTMHEWLSMVLMVPFVLHVWKNWRGLLSYARRGTLVIPLVACLVVAIPFAHSGLTGTGGGGNPAFRIVRLLSQASLTDLAPVMKTTPDVLLTRLQEQGYQVQSADQTIAAVAKASGKRTSETVLALMPSTSQQ